MVNRSDALFCCLMGDKRHKYQKRADEQREKYGKSIYEQVMSGDIEPQGSQKGWKNLRPIPITQRDPEERREICQKGAQAVNKIRGEEKTAKQSLDRMLSILATEDILNSADIETSLAERLRRENPDMTLYDAMNAAAIGRALSGNVKAMEYVRDTRGDAPVKQVEITENVTTESDRAMMAQLAEMLQNGGTIEVVKDVSAEDIKDGNDIQ